MLRSVSLLLAAFLIPLAFGADKPADKPADDADAGLKKLKLPKDFKVSLWTSKKQVMNPTAITFDDQNRMYVAETFRFRDGGGLDIRESKFMFFDDIQLTTPADRRAMYEKYKDRFKPGYFTTHKEKILLLEDTQHSGKADSTTVFAEAFDDALDGPAVGICYNDGKIYLACCPKIWELTGANGSGKVDQINTFFDGMCVRVGISGHDVHGTIVGPDGKLYWSIGDRGYNVTGKEGQKFVNPRSGAVFRANLDGSELELYYTGLRNPQDLAFDDFGNLFTCDNNADIGDASRLTYILEGGSSGWTMGWQLLGYADFAKLGGLGDKKPDPWLEEGIWKMRFDSQPAHILPPAGLLTNGPVGMAFYPGTGLPDSYARHFFVCDYTAGDNSGVHSCTADEDGAGFVMKNAEKFLWGVTATDVAFGYDGKVYVSDYGGGWNLPMKGSILSVWEPEALKKPGVAEVQELFADGFDKQETAALAKELSHGDMRVRQRAQFELVKRGKEGYAALTEAARNASDIHARVHGIWGLAQLARTEKDALQTLAWLLHDDNARVREQAAKMLGDAHYEGAIDKLIPLLTDANARVKTFAAIALGKMHCSSDVAALTDILRENADKDAFLRHGAIMGLAGSGDASALRAHTGDPSKAVRLGMLLALRRMEDSGAAAYLKDSDPQIYAEAVRAIYDTPIKGALPELQTELDRILETPDAFETLTPLLLSRIVQANYRYGSADRAAALAKFAALPQLNEAVRMTALEALEKWEEPTLVDPITGLPRAVPKRAKLVPDEAVRAALKKLLNENGAIAAKAADMALAFGVELADDLLISFVKNNKRGEALRVTSIGQLTARKSKDLLALLPELAKDSSLPVRVAALGAQLELDPSAGVASARAILDDSVPPENKIKVVTDRTNGDFANLTMGAPSKEDYADASAGHGVVFTYVKGFGAPNPKAGADGMKLPRLNDGVVPQNEDDTDRNVWLDANGGRILCDLQKPVEIGAVNTYSWHVRDRAPQSYTLWGSDRDAADPAAKELKKDWVEIAKVDTRNLNDGGKHGSLVFNAGGSVGKYRYLLWQITKPGNGTFFSEIDVYEKGKFNYVPMAARRLQQQVFQVLGKSKAPGSGEIVGEWLEKLTSGKVPPVLHLDLLEAAEARGEEAIKAKVKEYYKGFPETDKLASFRVALLGGDVKCGEEVFQFHAAACMRCHKVADGHGGGDAGPKLAGVGSRLTREKILESLVEPSAVIVPGFGTTTFKLQDGRMISGSVTEENEKEITLKDAEGKVIKLAAADIKKRAQPVSPMPPMGPVLRPREMRDLIEYLSSLK